MGFRLEIVNESTVAQPTDIEALLVDLNAQIHQDFNPAWGIDAVVGIGPGGWPITLRDMPGPDDPQDALGYHDIGPTGQPYAIIFCKLAQDQGIPWTSVVSHEALEMLADPLVVSTVFIDTSEDGDGTDGVIIPIEACDPVEDHTYTGAIHGIALSNFVYPQWFLPGYTGQVDHLDLLKSALQMSDGGYANADIVDDAEGWNEMTADDVGGLADAMQAHARTTQKAHRRAKGKAT